MPIHSGICDAGRLSRLAQNVKGAHLLERSCGRLLDSEKSYPAGSRMFTRPSWSHANRSVEWLFFNLCRVFENGLAEEMASQS